MASLAPFSASAANMELAITATVLAPTALVGTGNSIRICNEGPNLCYIAVGGAAIAATVANSTPAVTATPIMAGEDVIFSRNPSTEGYISAITDTGKTATIQVAVGEGI